MNTVVPGSELTKEPFRWDHRVFSIVIQFPASIPPDSADFPQIPFADRTPIDTMCVATAGVFVSYFGISWSVGVIYRYGNREFYCCHNSSLVAVH